MSIANFTLKSKYQPSPDQAVAITEIEKNIRAWNKFQTLWWVTGSGKTFTMANVIKKIDKPTLIIAHNKTLAAQLAQEFKEFFPDNAVHYFVSYYDYYQPEAYVSKTDTYIEKEATINEEIDRLRHAATQDLLSRKDVIIVASVSCIYGIGDISAYTDQVFQIAVGNNYVLEELLSQLISIQYKRAGTDFKQWMFMVMGDVLEIFPASSETVFTIEFWWDEVSQITSRNYLTWEIYEYHQEVTIFPAKHTVTSKGRIEEIIPNIQKELNERLKYFKDDLGDVLRYERLKTKVEYDLEMMKEVGYVNGIENYSRYLDGRNPGASPATLMDYFGDDYLCLVDESHMTFSQIWGMYAWDKARKTNLVENGFRLPSAMDNRPLQFQEFENKLKNIVAVSATPWKYEIEQSCKDPQKFFDFNPLVDGSWIFDADQRVIPQIMRPTWLLDPVIVLRPMTFMVDDVTKNIEDVIATNQRLLITTLTKKSSEELTDYLLENGFKVKYLHSEIETLERLETLRNLREGSIDVIVWVNLLREWLDLPEVSKICILDSDKQWFLRSTSALIQIIGRAARNEDGTVYMYCEQVDTNNIQKVGESESTPEASEPVNSSQTSWETTSPQPSPWGEGVETKRGRRKKEVKYEFVENNPYLWELYGIDKAKMCNTQGLVISAAMKKAIELNYYRRNLQADYNKQKNITPKTVYSEIKDMWLKSRNKKDYAILDKKSTEKELVKLALEMDIASANMEYEKAAEIRDRIIDLKKGWKKPGA